MIPKSGYRFSEKIMLKQTMHDESDSTQLNQTLVQRPRRAADRAPIAGAGRAGDRHVDPPAVGDGVAQAARDAALAPEGADGGGDRRLARALVELQIAGGERERDAGARLSLHRVHLGDVGGVGAEDAGG